MKIDDKNWVPRGMVYGFFAGFAAALVLAAILLFFPATGTVNNVLLVIMTVAAAVLLIAGIWMRHLHNTFSYEGKRKLSKTIVEGVAS